MDILNLNSIIHFRIKNDTEKRKQMNKHLIRTVFLILYYNMHNILFIFY